MIKFFKSIGFVFFTKLFKNYFLEMQLFAFIRSFSDGITFFECKVNLDRYKSEHSPAFQLELTILNMYNHIWIYQTNIEEEW
jgi:hypothetical protein